MCFLSSFCPERVHFTLWSHFQKTPEFYNPWNFSKPDLSSGAHMGNQMLPSIPAASSLSVWKMCAGASQQCEITPLGGQRKGSQPKNVTWIPLSVPSFVMTLLHSTGTTYRNVIFFVVHYKLLLLMLFFVVMLRNNLVAFGIVLPRILVHALSSTNNLAVSGNTSLCNFVHLLLQWLNTFLVMLYILRFL